MRRVGGIQDVNCAVALAGDIGLAAVLQSCDGKREIRSASVTRGELIPSYLIPVRVVDGHASGDDEGIGIVVSHVKIAVLIGGESGREIARLRRNRTYHGEVTSSREA